MNITLKVTKQSASIVGEPVIDEVDFVLNFGHIIQGKSAYQQAVEAGYNGSEEEFMNRLAKAGSLIGTADVENGAITEEKLEPEYRESLASKSYVNSSRSTYTITSFTAIDIWNAFHSGDESASDLMVSLVDISEIDKALQEGKVILIRANEQSNSVYVCDAINEGGLVRITYRDTAAHTVSFLFNPEEAEPYIWIDRHTSSLPSGGEAGQVLAKTGEGIDDVEWQTPPTATYILPFTHEEVVEWAGLASENVGRIMDPAKASEIGEAIKANMVVMIHTEDGYYPCSAKVEDMVYINYLDNDGNVVAISFDISGTFDSADVKPIGLPAGGREDQVLSKYSDANQYAWIDLPAYTTIIQSFTAEDVKNAFHSGDESASDLMVSLVDISEIDKALQEGKVILIRANEQSNSVYVCDAINEGGLVRITYRDTAAHTVSFRFNPEEAEPYIWIDRHTSSLPSGGEVGQVLTKTGEGIDDVEWVDVPQGGGGGTVEGAVLYTPQTLTDEQKSQVAKNIGQPRERLILEWKNDQAEVLQPTAYDAETGYFTVESMPSWLAEDGAIVACCINYSSTVLQTNVWNTCPKPQGNEAYGFYIKRVTETQVMLFTDSKAENAATIPSTVNAEHFYFNQAIAVGLSLPQLSTGIKRYRILLENVGYVPSKYKRMSVSGYHTYIGSNISPNFYDLGLGYVSQEVVLSNIDIILLVNHGEYTARYESIKCEATLRTGDNVVEAKVYRTLFGDMQAIYYDERPRIVFGLEGSRVKANSTIKLYEIIE